MTSMHLPQHIQFGRVQAVEWNTAMATLKPWMHQLKAGTHLVSSLAVENVYLSVCLSLCQLHHLQEFQSSTVGFSLTVRILVALSMCQF